MLPHPAEIFSATVEQVLAGIEAALGIPSGRLGQIGVLARQWAEKTFSGGQNE